MPQLDVSAMQMIIIQMIILILSIAVHEFGHAFVADRLGDRLPRSEGRVTLNPMAHADPIGTLAFPALFLFMSGGASMGFGWGRPVMVHPPSFSRRFSMRTGHMFVALAGPVMNILFGIVISLLLFALLKTEVLTFASERDVFLITALRLAVMMNFLLAFFNLLPVPPLDGGTVVAGILPRRLLPAWDRYTQYGIFAFMALFILMQNRAVARVLFWPVGALYGVWGRGVLGLP